MIRLPLLLVLFAAGCASQVPPPAISPVSKPQFVSIEWAPKDFRPWAVNAWKYQIRGRWPDRDIVAIFCHGQDKPWTFAPDGLRRNDKEFGTIPVETVVAAVRHIFPHHLIVVVACNTEHVPLRFRDVAYALDPIWVMPGPDYRWTGKPDELAPLFGVGGIDEFVETGR